MQGNAFHKLAIVAVLVASTAAAQENGLTSSASEGFPIGPFLFSPAVEISWEDRDNITFAPVDEIADSVFLARSRLQLELPVYDSYLRLNYMPQYRAYRDYDLAENWQHFLTLDGAFRFANGLELTGGYAFVAGNLETREIDPGGELVFGERPFDKHELRLAGSYWLDETNGLRVEAGATTVVHDPGAHELFYDYDSSSGMVSWVRQVRPTLQLEASYRFDSFAAQEGAAAFRDADGHELSLAANGQLTPVLWADLRVGYRRRDLERPEATPQDDFGGFVTRGSLTYEFGHGGRATLRLLRSDFASAYAANAYYTATGAALLYELTRDRLFSHLRYEFQRNEYDVPDPLLGALRSDDISTWSVGAGYRLNDFSSLRASFTHQDRSSFDRFSYDADILLLGLVVGY